MAFNAANLTRCSPQNVTGPALYTYYSSTDNAATVSTSTYFAPFADSYSQNYFPFFFNVGDTIQCTCSDVNVNLDVTSITPVTVTEQTVDVVVGPNSVNTAAIQAQAVTAAKIANGTITTTQISNTAGITGTQIAATTVAAANIVNATITTTQISNTAGITGAQIAATTVAAGNIVANTITASQLALSVPQVIRVPITSANFKTAYTAGLACITAGGANTIIVIDKVTYSFNYLTAAYTSGGVIQLQYSTGAPVNAGGIAATSGVTAATLTSLSANGYITDNGALAINASAGLVNAGVWLTVATANFASGSGTVVANISYYVVTI